MKLDVEIIRQGADSIECGIASSGMILKHLDYDFNYEEIRSDLIAQLDTLGLSAPRLGLYLIRKFDLDVRIITLNPYILSINQINGTQKEIYERIVIRKEMLKEKHDQDIVVSFLEFMDNGGTVLAEIPTFEHIKSEIDSNRPLIASITSNFLFGKLRFNFHYNIITGYDDEYVFVNDPNADETGGKHKHKISHYLYAIHSAAYGDVDNGCLITISPKKL